MKFWPLFIALLIIVPSALAVSYILDVPSRGGAGGGGTNTVTTGGSNITYYDGSQCDDTCTGYYDGGQS